MARRSLRDRNSAAIAHESAEPTETLVTPDVEEPAVLQPALVAEKRPAVRSKKTQDPAGAGFTDRLGIYLTPAEFNGARAAYLADWSNGGEADTFARWIAVALDAHASRTPKQRADRGGLRGRSEERTGSTRSFNIPTVTMKRMRAAITADQQAGRWPSDSAWAAEAIGLAVDDARASNGGTLPTPPDRLPNRLVR